MGKKGSWFSAIKKVLSSHSKDKLPNECDKKNRKEKKKGVAKLRHGDTKSLIPLFREPSSIEKILDEAERDHKLIFRPATPLEHPKTPPFVPRVAASSPKAASPWPPTPKNIPRHKEINYNRIEPTLRNYNASATKIQAAYRGYIARRSFRALKGVVRLQGVVRGQSVKRQTMNAMKYMQLLVRLQSQIQSQRIQMLENQSRSQPQFKTETDLESMLGKWSVASEAGNEDWDASLLTKEENEARFQRKVDALVNRDRAMSYAYSHQLWKSTPKSAHTNPADAGWWNWFERQLPPTTTPRSTQHINNFQLTPPRPHSEQKPSPRNMSRTPVHTTTTTPPSMSLSRYSRTRANENDSSSSPFNLPLKDENDSSSSPFNLPLKDDDSMTSWPPFSAPNYMTPTVSAGAKARADRSPKERRFIGSFKWHKGSFFSGGKDLGSQRGVAQNQSVHSVGNLSVDSPVSMPAAVGRKPFNRFV